MEIFLEKREERPEFVSVVIPSHFRLDLVEQIIRCLNKQTYPKEFFEVIIVSTVNDGAKEKIEELKVSCPGLLLNHSRVSNDLSRGKDVSAKRRHGAAQAKGSWLAFLDNDMQPEPSWLENASHYFSNTNYAGIEGNTQIPHIIKPTLTYKGLLRVKNPGGFQSCNIFFRKSDFEKTEGFSSEFPWYLEDTDAAWSVLDLGKEIPFAEDVVAYHPVPPAAPWRLLHEAKGARLKPKLYRRHRILYRKFGMKILRRSHYLYLIGYYLLILSVFNMNYISFILAAMYIAILLSIHTIKMFWGLSFTFKELTQTLFYTLISPPVILINAVRGWREQKLDFKELFFLLCP